MFNFNKKKENNSPEDLKEVVKRFEKIEEENKKIKEELEEIRDKQKKFLENPGIVRFNPFPGEGGNQSFSLAFVNKKGDGVVITNFYTKEGNRIYGKPLEKGSCKYALSKEEREAIKKGLGHYE